MQLMAKRKTLVSAFTVSKSELSRCHKRVQLDAERAAAEQVARDAAEQAERNALLEAEQKAARDARYAARKAAKKQGGGAISPKPCALPAALDPQIRMSEMKPRERPSASPPNDGRLL
jgi:Family of unknown function (DUF6481)